MTSLVGDKMFGPTRAFLDVTAVDIPGAGRYRHAGYRWVNDKGLHLAGKPQWYAGATIAEVTDPGDATTLTMAATCDCEITEIVSFQSAEPIATIIRTNAPA